MEIKDLNRYGEVLETSLKLRTMPIGVKFCESEADVPKEAVYPKEKFGKHMALCQAFSYARMKGMTIAMRKEDHWCWNPLVGFGNVDCDPGTPSFDEVCKFIGIPGKEKAAEFFAGFPRLPKGKYPIVVIAPIKTCSFMPDVILVYAEAAKVNHMCRSIKTAIGGTFTSTFDGIDSCIYCTVPTFTKGEFRITFPDPGDRERARAYDDEVILSIPPEKMDAFMQAFESMNKFMGFDGRLLEFNLDFPHPPFYNTLFEMWGLDNYGTTWDVPAGK
ncbi:MAG: DUF169 domain-containing protein [Oscillospiraceae bacterium]|nr:DUF169 domain-containing protein [Oscillospiraceae bacterium]